MVLHSLVLVLAAVEASACLLLCVPLPESFVKAMVSLHKRPQDAVTVTISRTVLAVIVCLCVEALWDLYGAAAEERARQYRSQRNGLAAGCTLLLFILMRQMFSLTAEAMKAKLDKEVMAKQAKNQADQAEMVAKMLKQNEGDAAGKKEAAAPPDKESSASSAEADAALRKQTEQQASEYARLVEENVSLKAKAKAAAARVADLEADNESLSGKLEAFELLMGDAKKKSE